jgi:hypothetical protein
VSEAAPATSLLDSQGCVNEAGFRALEESPPGRGPAEVAAHVAGCPRCQQRLLAGASGRLGMRPPLRKAPPLSRSFLLVGATLAAILLALWSLRWLL